MQRKKLLGFALIAGLFIGAPALAQSICWRQPWTRPSASFESTVFDCANPQPMDRVAMDDFVCDYDATLVRIHWWGAILDPAQLNRPFYIAIYKEVDNCQPAATPDAVWCVQARAKFQALDCDNQRVFRFSAKLPTPFTAVAGDKYWIQISEIDEQSANPGAVDFRWSSHRPIRRCPAMQRDAAGSFFSPLTDICDDVEEDLAFVLFSKTIIGTILVPNVLPPVLVLQLYPVNPTAGDTGPAETLIVEPGPNGNFDVDPSVPDGTYNWVLYGMSAKPETGQVVIADGTETTIGGGPLGGGAIEPAIGDVDSNGQIGIVDLLRVLADWG